MSEQASRLEAWAARLARLSRLVRIVIAGLVAVLVAVFVSQVMTVAIGDAALYDPGTARVVFLVTGVAFVIGYGVGWWALIGFDRDPAPQVGRRAALFVLVGVLVGVALLFWLVISLVIAMLPPEIPI